jgi:antitoxin PrlF
MPTATVTSKGQVTLPRRVRDLLRVGPGDRIEFVIDDDGRISVRARDTDIAELRGMLHEATRGTVTLDAMERAIRRRGEPS